MFVLLGVFFLGNLDVQIISPILPFIQNEFSVSSAAIGFPVMIYAISGAVWALVIGPLSDRYGRMQFIRGATVCLTIASIIAFFSHSFVPYLIARGLAGLAGGTFSACIIAQIADQFSFEQRGKAMGAVGATLSLAAVFGGAAGAFIASSFGWRILYMGLIIISAFFVLITPGSSPVKTSQNTRSDEGTGSTIMEQISGQINQYFHFWTGSQTRHGLVLAILITATSTSIMAFLGLWLRESFGIEKLTFALVYVAAGLSTVIGSLAGGYLGDRLGKDKLVAFGSLFILIITMSPFFISTIPGVFCFAIFGGLAISLREGPYQALITELVDSQARGAYIAMRSTTAKLGMALASVFASIFYQWGGYVLVAAFAGLCSLAAAITVWFFIAPKLTDSLSPSQQATGK